MYVCMYVCTYIQLYIHTYRTYVLYCPCTMCPAQEFSSTQIGVGFRKSPHPAVLRVSVIPSVASFHLPAFSRGLLRYQERCIVGAAARGEGGVAGVGRRAVGAAGCPRSGAVKVERGSPSATGSRLATGGWPGRWRPAPAPTPDVPLKGIHTCTCGPGRPAASAAAAVSYTTGCIPPPCACTRPPEARPTRGQPAGGRGREHRPL